MTDTPIPGAATAAPARPVITLRPGAREWLAAAFVVLLAMTMLVLAFVVIPPPNRDLFVFLTGQVVGAGLMAIINFYFGSSKGAADVRAQLGQALEKLPDAQP